MGKIDEIKEHIGALKTYLSLIVAMLLAIGAGTSKLYLDGNTGALFYLGIMMIIALVLIFIVIARSMHKNIKKLEEL